MEQLSPDWLTKGHIDFEYKKYMILAYLSSVKGAFDRMQLYPFLGDLVFHYKNLLTVKENKTLIREGFPKEISIEELKNLELSYRQIVADDALMQELESIVEFSIPQFRDSIQEGTVIYDYVESRCEISPIGVTPLYAKEGYLFVTQPPERETDIYRYQTSIFEDVTEQFRGLHMQFVSRMEKNTANTYENLKLVLVRQFRDMPNPATYLVISKTIFPFDETLLPVIKRLFIKHLSLSI